MTISTFNLPWIVTQIMTVPCNVELIFNKEAE